MVATGGTMRMVNHRNPRWSRFADWFRLTHLVVFCGGVRLFVVLGECVRRGTGGCEGEGIVGENGMSVRMLITAAHCPCGVRSPASADGLHTVKFGWCSPRLIWETVTQGQRVYINLLHKPGWLCGVWGNVSAPGARPASFVTRAPPVDCCR